jgi:fermentation-respiration switch protein FrsA (DUF1100 family)
MNQTSVPSQTMPPITLEQTAPSWIIRKRRMLLTLILSTLLFCISLLLAFHAYIAWNLARPHIDPLTSDPTRAVGLPYDKIAFPSRNGESHLEGWFIPGSSKKTVIFSHGYGGNREELWVPFYTLAKELHKQKYNVIMFDYGYVQPDSNRIVTGGVQESQELLGAVDFVKNKIGGQVYIWGFSMGAGTALQAALNSENEITGMILDSTFLLNPDTLYHNMKQYVNVPKFPSLPLVRLFFPVLNGVSLKQIPSQKVIRTDYTMPIFFIHGDKDHMAPYEMIEDIYASQQSNLRSDLWILPSGQHELLYRAKPEVYLRRTTDFLTSISSSYSPDEVYYAGIQ